MKRSIVILSSLITVATAGQAAADTAAMVAKAYGNTILTTYPDGRKSETWLKSDGTYTAEGRRRDRSNGKWKIKDDKICFRQSHPSAPPISVCIAIPADGLEHGFDHKAITGEMTKITLVHGHSVPG